MKSQASAFLILLSLLLAGCNYTKVKGGGIDENKIFNMPPEQKAQLSFSYVYQNVFLPKCISCHGNSGGVNLESYQAARSHLAAIKKTVFETKTMPKRGSLSFDEQAILWNWIAMGAPKDSEDGTTPIPDPLTPTFDSISKNIFAAKCVTCHSAGNPGQRILLDKDSLLNSPLELVIPGNADESGLVVAIERTDDKRMPPAKEGYSKLSDEEITAIREWITNGATD